MPAGARGVSHCIHPEGPRPDGFSRSVGREYAGQSAIWQNQRQDLSRLLFHVKKKLLEFGTARIGKSRSERGRKCVQKIRENLKKNYFVAREVFGDVFSGVRVCLVVQAQGRRALVPRVVGSNPARGRKKSKIFEMF